MGGGLGRGGPILRVPAGLSAIHLYCFDWAHSALAVQPKNRIGEEWPVIVP